MESPSTTVEIRMSCGNRFSLSLVSSLEECTVLQVKERIASMPEACSGGDDGECPVDRQRLVYKGRILADDRTLSDYGVVEGVTIHLVKYGAPVAPTPTPVTNTNTGIAGNTSSTSMHLNSRIGSSPDQNSGLHGNSNANTPDISSMQENMMQNPEMMQNMMNNPMVQSLMDNPDFMRNMMENNPQMRSLMESNPELRQVMDDPQLWRQSMEMMRNPDAMQQMMRSQDLAMSQLENIPGGFAAMSSMYRNVQEPMMDAMGPEQTNENDNDSAVRSGNAAGATGQAMPNPWGATQTPTTPTIGTRSSTNTNRSNIQHTAPGMDFMNTNNNDTNMNMAMNMNMPTNMNNPWAAAPDSGSNENNPMNMDINSIMGNIGGGGVPLPNMLQPGSGGNPPQLSPEQMEQTLSMLENPMVSQMMDNFLQNPDTVRQMMESNPMMQQLRQSNPQIASMTENPEFMRTMMNPQNLRAMMQMQNSMQPMQGNGSSANGANAGLSAATMMPNSTGNGSPAALDFSTLLNQFQSTDLNTNNVGTQQQQQRPTVTSSNPWMVPSVPSSSSSSSILSQQANVPITPQVRFRNQLQSLRAMGFEDEYESIQALQANHGNVNRAVDHLLTGGGRSGSDGLATAPAAESATSSPPPSQEEEEEPKNKNSTEKKND